jgi:hypothetical protein
MNLWKEVWDEQAHVYVGYADGCMFTMLCAVHLKRHKDWTRAAYEIRKWNYTTQAWIPYYRPAGMRLPVIATGVVVL